VEETALSSALGTVAAHAAGQLAARKMRYEGVAEEVLSAAYDRCGEVTEDYGRTFYMGACAACGARARGRAARPPAGRRQGRGSTQMRFMRLRTSRLLLVACLRPATPRPPGAHAPRRRPAATQLMTEQRRKAIWAIYGARRGRLCSPRRAVAPRSPQLPWPAPSRARRAIPPFPLARTPPQCGAAARTSWWTAPTRPTSRPRRWTAGRCGSGADARRTRARRPFRPKALAPPHPPPPPPAPPLARASAPRRPPTPPAPPVHPPRPLIPPPTHPYPPLPPLAGAPGPSL
jgi:hypothetical protein